jgi:hypothetical protein
MRKTSITCILTALIICSVVITELVSNLVVIPLSFPLAPTADLHVCDIIKFETFDCNFWKGQWYSLGSESTYILQANDSDVSCTKDTGCQNYRTHVPTSKVCFATNDNTCWELVEFVNNNALSNRNNAYLLNSLFVSPGIVVACCLLCIIAAYEEKQKVPDSVPLSIIIPIDKY